MSDPLEVQPYRESGTAESEVILRAREVLGDETLGQVFDDGYTV
jgi:hypothetical protein